MKANCDEMTQNYTERKKTRQIAAQLLHASRNVHQLLDNNVNDHRVGERVQVGLPPHGAESHRRRCRRHRRRRGRRGRCAEAARYPLHQAIGRIGRRF